MEISDFRILSGWIEKYKPALSKSDSSWDNSYCQLARKHGNVTVEDFRKYEKLKEKHNKLKLDIDFLNNCKQLGVYLKFLIFKLQNVSNKDALSIRKRLFRSTISKRNKELQHVLKELSQSETFLFKQPAIYY